MADAPVLPSWRYHVSGAARIIETPEDLKALATGEWFESPAAAADAAAVQAEAAASAPARTTRRTSSGHAAPDQ